MRFNVKWVIDLTVEADNYDDAIKEVLCIISDTGTYTENEITEQIRTNADVRILGDEDF